MTARRGRSTYWIALLTVATLLTAGLVNSPAASAALNPSGPAVAIMGSADPLWVEEVADKMFDSGRFSQVDVYDLLSTTPTLGEFLQYDSVLVFTDSSPVNKVTLGDNMADYVDAGGRLVVATFGFYCSSGYGLDGRITTDPYLPFTTQCNDDAPGGLTLIKDLPADPLMSGVNSFNGGTSSYHEVLSLVPGATQVAHWSNGIPLVGTLDNNGHTVYGLNFFPPSTDSRSDFWDANTDGDVLIANALGGAASFTPPPPPQSQVTVTADPATASEGGADGSITFTRGVASGTTIEVKYNVTGTATSGDDYTPIGSTATIAAGDSSTTVHVHALTDDVADDGETVTVTLAPGASYTVGTPNTATVTINDSPTACANAQPAPYTDRDQFDVHAGAIDCITAYNLAQGYPDGTFRATIDLSRAQIASLLARLVQAAGVTLPASPADAYPGDNGDVHELAINQIAELGLLDDTTGQSAPNYGVSDPIKREDMAQMLYNAFRTITGAPLPAGPDAFSDDDASDNQDAINALAAQGVIEGTGGGLYEPDGTVSRGQFASFFARYVQVMVNNGAMPPL